MLSADNESFQLKCSLFRPFVYPWTLPSRAAAPLAAPPGYWDCKLKKKKIKEHECFLQMMRRQEMVETTVLVFTY